VGTVRHVSMRLTAGDLIIHIRFSLRISYVSRGGSRGQLRCYPSIKEDVKLLWMAHLKPSDRWQRGLFSKSKPAEDLSLEEQRLGVKTTRIWGLTMCFEHSAIVSLLISMSENGWLWVRFGMCEFTSCISYHLNQGNDQKCYCAGRPFLTSPRYHSTQYLQWYVYRGFDYHV